MNTKENIKNAIMKMAVSDPEKLIATLDLAYKCIGHQSIDLVVSWMKHNLKAYGCIFPQTVNSHIRKSSIDSIADIIAYNADEIAESMPQHLAKSIGLEVPEETYYVQVRSKQYWNVVFEDNNLTESEVVEALREYVGRPYVVKMYANLVGEWVDSWQFVTSRIDKTELEAKQK